MKHTTYTNSGYPNIFKYKIVTLLQFKDFKITKDFKNIVKHYHVGNGNNAAFPILPYKTAKADLNHTWQR